MSKLSWRILLYAMVKDDEELAFFNTVVDDLKTAFFATDECGLVVQIHGKEETYRHWISKGQHEPEILRWVDGSAKKTLTAFIDDAAARLDASSTALIIWAHGRGIEVLTDEVETHAGQTSDGAHSRHQSLAEQALHPPPRFRMADLVGPQLGPNTYLSNVDLRAAIAESSLTRVDVLALNACVMALLEVAFEWRAVAEVMVLSQVFANSWSFGKIGRQMARHPPQSARELGGLIVRYADEEIKAGERTDAVSAVASEKLDELFEAFNAYAARVTELVKSDWGNVKLAVTEKAQRVHDPYQVDLVSLLSVLGATDPESSRLARAATALLKAQVLLGSASLGSLHGLSIFCPKSTSLDVASAYQGFQFSAGNWLGFLRAFQEALRAQAPQASPGLVAWDRDDPIRQSKIARGSEQ